jgi:hypothetical protein
MENLFKFTIAAALGFALTATAQIVPAYSSYAAGTTNGASALSWAISSAHSLNDGIPVVTYINASSDKAASKVQFYLCTEETVAKYANNSTTTLSVNDTNGFASGDVIIIRHAGTNDTYEKRILTTMTAATNLVVTVAPMTTVVPGDIIYRMTTTGAPFIPCVTNTYTAANSGLSVVQSGPGIVAGSAFGGHTCPILAEVDGTSSASLNSMNVIYVPQR